MIDAQALTRTRLERLQREECTYCDQWMRNAFRGRVRCLVFRAPTTMSAGMLMHGLCPVYARQIATTDLPPSQAPVH